MIYLSGGIAKIRIDEQIQRGIGVMLTPAAQYTLDWVPRMPHVAIDNGCFSTVRQFKLDAWLRWVATIPATSSPVLFITVPDVVGDAHATRQRWVDMAPIVRATGYPLAFVLQDGQDASSVPWDECDAVFIGGSTDWKLSPAAAALSREAKRRGLWSHMGRVNSGKRLEYAARIGCDSADGTHMAFDPIGSLSRMTRWLQRANNYQLHLDDALTLATAEIAMP